MNYNSWTYIFTKLFLELGIVISESIPGTYYFFFLWVYLQSSAIRAGRK